MFHCTVGLWGRILLQFLRNLKIATLETKRGLGLVNFGKTSGTFYRGQEKKGLRSLSKGVFERRKSTGSKDFSFLICLDAMKFVLVSFFTLVETIQLEILAKQRLRNVKSLLPVDMHRSKTPLLTFISYRRVPVTIPDVFAKVDSAKLNFLLVANSTSTTLKWSIDNCQLTIVSLCNKITKLGKN